MASFCWRCGKGKMRGHKVSHAKNRTNRVWKPNLHPFRMMWGGVKQRVWLCSRCLRTVKAEQSEAVKKAKIEAAVAAV